MGGKVFEKAVVTGGAGFIGSHIVDKLVELGAEEVVVIDNFSSGRIENLLHHLGKGVVRVVKKDLRLMDGELTKAFRGTDAVFHYAANPEVRTSSTEPRLHFENNVVATFNALECARLNDVEINVFASSSTVYGDAKVIPTPEDYHPLEPISIYGASKLSCEALYAVYSKLYGFKVLILRYANIVGPRTTHGVIVDFIQKLSRDPARLKILGDGSQRKSYLYVTEAVEASMHALNFLLRNGLQCEVFNVGNDDWITVREIADIVVEAMGLSNVEYEYEPMTHDGRGWPGDVKYMLLDIAKLKNSGWRPSISSRRAVELTVKDLLKLGFIKN